MAKVVVMPKMGLTMTEGTVSKWLKKIGDEIKEGEPFFEAETDKLTNTIEATASGVVRHFFVEEGTTVPVLEKVAIIADAGEDISALLGGCFLLVMDDLARSLLTMEIPIGVLTAFFGAPFFVMLIVKRGRN